MRYCAPVVTSLQSAFRGVNDCFVITVLHIPFGGQLNKPVEISLLYFWIEASLVKWVQVVAYVHEFCTIKNLTVTMHFNISCHKCTHPVISYDDGREDFELTK